MPGGRNIIRYAEMKRHTNSRLLVLRRDTATGMTLVGWDEDLPAGRFEHLGLVCESEKNILPMCDSNAYDAYQAAVNLAREANRDVLKQQIQANLAKGWHRVPFDLAHDPLAMKADSIGNYADAAMQLHYQLTRNQKHAWVVFRNDGIIHVRARYPKKMLDELTYQVWYFKQKQELGKLRGDLSEGTLIINESGLWFDAM